VPGTVAVYQLRGLYLADATIAPVSGTFAASCSCQPSLIVTGSGREELAAKATAPPVIKPPPSPSTNTNSKNRFRIRSMPFLVAISNRIDGQLEDYSNHQLSTQRHLP
jgi:hypothetical protein